MAIAKPMTTAEMNRTNARYAFELANALKDIVPSVLDKFDGKCYNKRFVSALNELATSLAPITLGNGKTYGKVYFTEVPLESWQSRHSEKVDGVEYYAYNIKAMNYNAYYVEGAQYDNNYCNTIFSIYVDRDKRISKVVSSDESFNRYCGISYTASINNLMACYNDLSDRNETKLALNDNALKAMSKAIMDVLVELNPECADKKYLCTSDFKALCDAVKEMKGRWYNNDDYKGLYFLHNLL